MDYFNQESKRLTYRKLVEGDLESWKEFFIANDRLPFLGMDPNGDTNTFAKDWINNQLIRNEEHGLGHLATIEKESGNFIGLAGIVPRIVDGTEYMEIAYSLKPPYWGKGFGTEMATQLKTFGFQHKIANRFISIIHKDNADSIGVAKKNGMQILFETKYLDMDVFIFGIDKT